VLVSVVLLDVVVVHPPIVLFEQPAPVLGSLEVVVGHPPLDAPGGFKVALPGLSLLYLQLADAQSPVDGLRPVGQEDGAGVGDECLRRTVVLYRPVEDREEGVKVLSARQSACEQRP
jgi:hypothetical protein